MVYACCVIELASPSAHVRPVALVAAMMAAGLIVSGCGKSANDESASSTAESATSAETSAPAAPPAPPRVSAKGLVNSVAGSTLSLTAKEGPSSVAITSSTKVFKVSPAELPDVTVGSCVDVQRGTAPSAAAKRITVSARGNGKCAEASTDKRLRGQVTAVNGNSVTVANAPSAITVDQKTTYLKQESVSALAITQGSCLSASGSLDPGRVLQAVSATIVPPAANGLCPGV